MMKKISVLSARNKNAIGTDVRLSGWVRTRRDSKGGFSFIEINDGSCFGNIQIIADADLANYESDIKKLTAGCSVSIEGQVKESGGKGQATEIQAKSVTVHGWADPETYPLQKKRHSMEKLREWAHLRPRTNTFGAVARVRNCICNSIHQFYQEQGFIYVHTPVITASDCEGAGEMFKVTTLDLEAVPKDDKGKVDYTYRHSVSASIWAMALGRQLVSAYYATSPPLADAIAGSDAARTVTRAVLAPVVGAAKLWLELPWAFALAGAALAFRVLRRRG